MSELKGLIQECIEEANIAAKEAKSTKEDISTWYTKNKKQNF